MLLKQIGVIHSVYHSSEQAPRQGKYSEELATIQIFDEYQEAMEGLENIKSIIVLYWGNQANRDILKSTPPFMTQSYGVFSIRSPHRPNPIAMCVCKIVSIEKNKIVVKGLDALDGSPLLDIKNYIARVDTDEDYRK